MSALFVFLALLSSAFFVLMLISVFRAPRDDGDPEADTSLRRRLDEIDEDHAAGFFDAASAEEARVEAKRAELEKLAENDRQKTPSQASRRLRFIVIGYAALAPLLVAGVYFHTGSPGYESTAGDVVAVAGGQQGLGAAPNSPAAALANLSPEERQAAISNMVEGLAARLSENPDDVEGWRMLARSQMVLGRVEAARVSYRRLVAFDEATTKDWKDFATAIASTVPNGTFPKEDEFLTALDEIERRAPGDPFVSFSRGGVEYENGRMDEAIRIWPDLLSQIPENAAARDVLQRLINDARRVEREGAR